MSFKRAATLSVLLFAAACSSDADSTPAKATWSYEGTTGPAAWGDVSADYGTCKTGREQSPIDIPSSATPAALKIAVIYSAAPAEISDTGHTIEVDFKDGANRIELDGNAYKLLQFHFHKHSEHTVGGTSQPLELHLVHSSANGTLAVLGVLFKVGADSAALAEVFTKMATATEAPAELGMFDPTALIPTDSLGWSYAGSLTTPPCTEGVKWNVFSTVQEVSAAQLGAFRYDPSARPTQPIGARVIGGS